MIDKNKIKIAAGRTTNRGNYVSMAYEGIEVCISDDRGDQKSISQIELKRVCEQQLESLFDIKR